MPELPEVETTRRGVIPHVVGKTISAVLIHEPRLRWPVSPELAQVVTGQSFTEVTRRGKYLLFGTGTGRVMIHLGMSGSLRIVPSQSNLLKHDHVEFIIDNDIALRFHDPRRFGSVFWLQGKASHDLIDTLGPEPLTTEFSGNYLFNLSRGRRTAIKNFIMNSKVVVGVGNIYANEALFMSGINPSRLASNISKIRLSRLVDSIKDVLDKALEAGGTTLRDFVREDGSPGYFKLELKVYGRAGKPCFGCGNILKQFRLGNRSTFFCSHCQH